VPFDSNANDADAALGAAKWNAPSLLAIVDDNSQIVPRAASLNFRTAEKIVTLSVPL
jgi:hypothetical protein